MADGLMTETHPEHWCHTCECCDRITDDAGLFWSPRTWGEQHTIGCHGNGFTDCDLVVAHHHRVGTKLAQILNEVVDEAVITVDDEYSCHLHSLPAG